MERENIIENEVVANDYTDTINWLIKRAAHLYDPSMVLSAIDRIERDCRVQNDYGCGVGIIEYVVTDNSVILYRLDCFNKEDITDDAYLIKVNMQNTSVVRISVKEIRTQLEYDVVRVSVVAEARQDVLVAIPTNLNCEDARIWLEENEWCINDNEFDINTCSYDYDIVDVEYKGRTVSELDSDVINIDEIEEFGEESDD